MKWALEFAIDGTLYRNYFKYILQVQTMCLCVKPYRDNTIRCLDELVPAGNVEKAEPERASGESDLMTDNLGLTYVAVRNSDFERFSTK